MWEDRKYVIPHPPGTVHSHPHHHPHNHHHPPSHHNHHHRQPPAPPPRSDDRGPFAYDPTEDLHAWSIYRQNLNADLSESAIGQSSGNKPSEKPFGNFQLKESTVNNILSHPKYGPSIKSHDPYTYLRFGLPRVKPSGAVSELGGRNIRPTSYHQNLTSDSASDGGDESPFVARRRGGKVPAGHGPNNRRIWKSNPDLAGRGGVTESTFMNGGGRRPLSRPASRGTGLNAVGIANGHSKAVSEVDLTRVNGFATRFGTKAPSQLHLSPTSPSSLVNGTDRLPHLIVKNLYYEVDKTSNFRKFCGAQRQKLRVLDNVSFEVKSGELLAIMATNAVEGTAILDILSDRFNKRTGRVKGDFILNGVFMSPKVLSTYLSYGQEDLTLCPQLTARQTLLFSSLLQKAGKRPGSDPFDPKKRSYQLLEELGLSEVRAENVSAMNESEKRRLLIAVQLLLDTDILLLDQPIKGMDIFDTFFLLEYLRQWALVNGRCVIMTIQPPTFEIFSMFSRVCLVSTGRILFTGRRRDLLPYFSYSADYPTPPFKNPSDYYLDLVTLDTLSPEAMMESSQRIEALVETWGRRPGSSVSQPGPPSITPPPPKKSGFAIQFLALWIRALIFTFPYNIIGVFRDIFLSLIVSILIGIVYWHVRVGREQEHLWDRVFFYHTMLAMSPIPIMMVMINDLHREKQYILNEVRQGLYIKAAYFCSMFLYSFPSATLIFLALSLPACSMAGLHNDLWLYLGLMVGYLHVLRVMVMFAVWSCNRRSTAGVLFGLVFLTIILTSGSIIHWKDLSMTVKWLHQLSPTRWTHEALIGWEFSSNVTLALSTTTWVSTASLPFLCSHNPIIQQENAILIKADCGLQSRSHILSWFSYKGGSSVSSSSNNEGLRSLTHPAIADGGAFLVFMLLSLITLLVLGKRKLTNMKKQ